MSGGKRHLKYGGAKIRGMRTKKESKRGPHKDEEPVAR